MANNTLTLPLTPTEKRDAAKRDFDDALKALADLPSAILYGTALTAGAMVAAGLGIPAIVVAVGGYALDVAVSDTLYMKRYDGVGEVTLKDRLLNAVTAGLSIVLGKGFSKIVKGGGDEVASEAVKAVEGTKKEGLLNSLKFGIPVVASKVTSSLIKNFTISKALKAVDNLFTGNDATQNNNTINTQLQPNSYEENDTPSAQTPESLSSDNVHTDQQKAYELPILNFLQPNNEVENSTKNNSSLTEQDIQRICKQVIHEHEQEKEWKAQCKARASMRDID